MYVVVVRVVAVVGTFESVSTAAAAAAAVAAAAVSVVVDDVVPCCRPLGPNLQPRCFFLCVFYSTRMRCY